jgi:pimeloyl-ACP methyl ester carboxylesterase
LVGSSLVHGSERVGQTDRLEIVRCYQQMHSELVAVRRSSENSTVHLDKEILRFYASFHSSARDRSYNYKYDKTQARERGGTVNIMNLLQPNKQAPLSTQDKIWYTTAGTSSKPALLLLHGIFNSHREFHDVCQYLEKDFYIILVDLPGHTNSRSHKLNNYRIPQIALELAKLIEEVSPTKKAHVAGVSYGGFIGLELARRRPDVVESLFETGGAPLGFKERDIVCDPYKVYAIMNAGMGLPDCLYYFLQARDGVHKDEILRAQSKDNFSMHLIQNGFGSCSEITMESIEEIKGVRVLAIAGGKQDNVDMTQQMGRAFQISSGRKDKGGSKAVVVRKAIHAWDDQFPELFASGIKAWVAGSDLPIEFEELK